MKKLYSKSYLSLANELGFDPSKIQLHNQYFFQQNIPRQYHKLATNEFFRLPQHELRTMLKMPCPISSQHRKINQQQEQLVLHFKGLRKKYSINQESACARCPVACSKRNEEVKDKKVWLDSMLLFLACLHKQNEHSYSLLRWSAAFKTVESLRRVLKDLKSLKTQKNLYYLLQSQQQPHTKQPEEKQLKQFSSRRFKL